MVQDPFHHDNVKVNVALDDRLKKATKKAPASDQVSELKELVELTTLYKTLSEITNLTYYGSEMGMFGTATVGGMEAAVRVIKTFPECQKLQVYACAVLRNLALCSIGKAKAIESGGIKVVLAAVNNHLDSASLCETVCGTLFNFANGSEENTGLLISLGGAAAVAKVRTSGRITTMFKLRCEGWPI
jgi:hypothetical protein